jgi:hypothetical protein
LKAAWHDLVEAAMGKEFANAVVTTDFRASAIGMEPLFDYREIESYLMIAGQRVSGGENRFAKQLTSPSTQRNVEKKVCNYLSFRTGENVTNVDETTLIRESQRISRAYPEMCIFKFFKAALDERMIGEVTTPEAQSAYAAQIPPKKGRKAQTVTPQDVARIEYDSVFGEGAFDANCKKLLPSSQLAIWPSL